MSFSKEALTGAMACRRTGSTTIDHPDTDKQPLQTYAFALAEELEFPALPIGPGETVIAGRAAWQTFVGRADRDRLSKAAHELEEKSKPPIQTEDVL